MSGYLCFFWACASVLTSEYRYSVAGDWRRMELCHEHEILIDDARIAGLPVTVAVSNAGRYCYVDTFESYFLARFPGA